MSASTPRPAVSMPVPQIQVSPENPPSDGSKAIQAAYTAAFHAPGLSKENKLDKAEETLSAPIKRVDDTYEQMKSFYTANASAFNSAGSALVSDTHLDPKAIEDKLNRFAETSKVIMQGLDILGKLHPFLGVAVLAFKGVVALDLARRQNNKKVIAIQVQMQDMIVVVFQLRNIRDPDDVGPDGTKLAARLGGLIQSIAKNITECGTACKIYSEKGFVSKTLKSKIYENQLTAYVQMFDDNKKKLEFELAVHTARGVDEANEKLDNQNTNLNLILVRMEELFRRLDTSRERDAHEFIETNKGAQACVENEATLWRLLVMGGEKVEGYDPAQPGKADLASARKMLSKELAEDVREVMERSMDSFARKMKLQGEELAETIINELSDKSIRRIRDPDLKALWEQQGWKASVEVRNFVLALNDYYADKFDAAENAGMRGSAAASEAGSGPPSPTETGHDFPTTQDDQWTLAYINPAHIQPISEAVDDDASGFVSSREANVFASRRPENWSLPQWTAFWAAGWHPVVTYYKNDIYKILHAMDNLVRLVLPANRNYAESYYGGESIDKIELLLRSTRSAPSAVLDDPDLLRLSIDFMEAEEEKLEARLATLLYQVDDSTAVALLTRRRRIERYVYPLLYLLLRRHFYILRLACIHTLNEAEFLGMSTSLATVLTAVDDRIKVLEPVFKSNSLDVKERLSFCFFGMFQMLHNPPSLPSSGSNTIITFVEEDGYAREGEEDLWPDSDIEEDTRKRLVRQLHIPEEIVLRHGRFRFPDRPEFEKQFPSPSPLITTTTTTATSTGGMNGSWTCLASVHPGAPSALLTLGFAVSRAEGELPMDELTVSAECLHHAKTVPGKTWDDQVVFKLWKTLCVGLYDPATESIGIVDADYMGGVFEYLMDAGAGREESDDDEEGIAGPVILGTLRRTPPAAYRHLYTQAELDADPVKARWKFALAAIRAEVQRKNCSGAYLRSRNAERKRWVELTVQDKKAARNFTPATPLTAEEKDELARLTVVIPPRDIQFYDALANFEVNKTIIPHYAICDGCRGRIYGERLVCLECMKGDNLNLRVDLCSNCFEKTFKWGDSVHEPRHVQVKTYRRIHPGYMSWMVPEAREVAKRARKLFAEDKFAATNGSDPSEESIIKDADVSAGGKAIVALKCFYCEEKISPPCFVCVECTPEVYICIECNKTRAAERSADHRLSHTLVYIFDTKPMVLQTMSSAGDAGATVEARLRALEKNMGSRFEALDARLGAVEALLKNLVAQLTGSSRAG
ncbi:hypothetical protein GGX14DRAFT_480287 [Mycena pura]|uniref:ZZ-type domain-containing protein n=1 Tax=Mycena pura TaxID=153505 RepID=A0AAD6UT34_9AGAR|nr:hypothetical protein GGX14DRAFT_480287 [Mycena pura]